MISHNAHATLTSRHRFPIKTIFLFQPKRSCLKTLFIPRSRLISASHIENPKLNARPSSLTHCTCPEFRSQRPHWRVLPDVRLALLRLSWAACGCCLWSSSVVGMDGYQGLLSVVVIFFCYLWLSSVVVISD